MCSFITFNYLLCISPIPGVVGTLPAVPSGSSLLSGRYADKSFYHKEVSVCTGATGAAERGL